MNYGKFVKNQSLTEKYILCLLFTYFRYVFFFFFKSILYEKRPKTLKNSSFLLLKKSTTISNTLTKLPRFCPFFQSCSSTSILCFSLQIQSIVCNYSLLILIEVKRKIAKINKEGEKMPWQNESTSLKWIYMDHISYSSFILCLQVMKLTCVTSSSADMYKVGFV